MRQIKQRSKRLHRYTKCVHLKSETEQTSHEERMFTFVHSAQEKDWWPNSDAIIIYTNPTFKQQEQKGITSLSDKIVKIIQACLTKASKEGIKSKD